MDYIVCVKYIKIIKSTMVLRCCFKNLGFVLFGDCFYGLYHGIHHHHSLPFGRICFFVFIIFSIRMEESQIQEKGSKQGALIR